MEFHYNAGAQFLERHLALVQLAGFLDCNHDRFIEFLEKLCLYEKYIDQEESAEKQRDFLELLFTDDNSLKRILPSSEWQRAGEYLVVAGNENSLLDICHKLEIGSKPSCSEIAKMRKELLHSAFIHAEQNGISVIAGVKVHFVVSSSVARWNLHHIEWQLQSDLGEKYLTGCLHISVGAPKFEGPELFSHLFSLYHSEKRAISILAARAIDLSDQVLTEEAEKLLLHIDFELEKIESLIVNSPNEVQEIFGDWMGLDPLKREYSGEGLELQCRMMNFFRSSPEKYQFFENRLKGMGLRLNASSAQGYAFSNEIEQEQIIAILPAVEYYWPYQDEWHSLTKGSSRICAGPFPKFLDYIRMLHQKKVLIPKQEDFESVEQMLLHILLGGEKVDKPPVMPVYNALRRWFETLTAGKHYQHLEQLCFFAKVFRSHIQIPHVGERPFVFAGKEHKFIPRPDKEREPGVIVGIKQAGLMVPDSKIPLFISGEYWIATDSVEENKDE